MVLEVGGSRPLAHPEDAGVPPRRDAADRRRHGRGRFESECCDEGPDGPRHRRVVGHRRRRRPRARRAGRHRGARGPAGRPARRGARRLPRHLARLGTLGGRPLGPRRRRPTWPCEIWDHYGGLDVVVNNAAVPMRRHVTPPDHGRGRADDAHQLLLPGGHLAGRAAADARAEVGDDRQRVEPRRPSRASRPRRPTRGRSSPWPAGASPWRSTSTGSGVSVKLILPGAIDTEIWDQPDNDAPLYDGPKEPPESIAGGHRRRHRQRSVRALPARHEGGH